MQCNTEIPANALRLRRMRDAGISYAEVARRIGAHRNSVSCWAWEQPAGSRRPKPAHIQALATAFPELRPEGWYRPAEEEAA